jgi:hypothetical protein
MDQDREAVVAELNRLNQMRQFAVVAAIGLLVVSIFMPSMALAVLRSAAWGAAGLLSLMHTSKAKQAGFEASYTNAVIYLLVAVVPLLKGR